MGGGISKSRQYHREEEENLKQVRKLLSSKDVDVNKPIQDGDTWLHLAAARGHTKLVQLLLENNANLEAKGGVTGNTALHQAAAGGSLAAAHQLIVSGANMEARNGNQETPMHIAAGKGHIKVVMLLGANRANPGKNDKSGRTPLAVAASEGHAEVVKYLLSQKADPNTTDADGMTPLTVAEGKGHREVVQVLTDHAKRHMGDPQALANPLSTYEDEYIALVEEMLAVWDSNGTKAMKVRGPLALQEGDTWLHLAVSRGHLKLAKFLIDRKANVNARDKRNSIPLHLASSRGYGALVELLVTAGAMVDAKNAEGNSPLHLAAGQGYLDVVKYLVAHKADTGVRNLRNNTPLHLAASHAPLSMVEHLVASGAAVDAKNSDGNSALHLAVSLGHLDTAQFLVAHEADTGSRNIFGRTPLAVAAKEGHLDTVNYLLTLNVDANAKDEDGNTPLSLAKAGRHVEIIEVLALHASRRAVEARTSFNQSAPLATQAAAPPSRMESGSAYIPPKSHASDLFLTHDWGVDKAGRNNHERVARVNAALKALGFTTWFDEDRMVGHIRQQMCAGIDGAKAVLVFVTARYMDKVNSDADDNCEAEFSYAVAQKSTRAMIPVVMEEDLLDTRNWRGVLKMNLGSKMYVSMVDDTNLVSSMPKLVGILASMGITPNPP
eukprot:jgi/Mesvir1/13051/Mv06039-RA.1